jgi:ABC-type transport system involved in multi-copper enzyme maturation permease subunit
MAAMTQHARPAAAGEGAGSRFLWGLRSEFTKLQSVRSTYWTLLVMVVLNVGLGALVSLVIAADWKSVSPDARVAFDPTTTSLSGMLLGQLIIAVLGTLTISSEYSTGMIRTSLAAQPHRVTYLAAKAAAFAVVAYIAGVVATFSSFLVGQALLAGTHANATLDDPGVVRSMFGGGLFIAGCGLFSMTVAVILRHTAGAIATAAGLLFLGPILVNFLPARWQNNVNKWLPSTAGSRIMEIKVPKHQFAPWTCIGVFAIYVGASMIVGLILFLRRDA